MAPEMLVDTSERWSLKNRFGIHSQRQVPVLEASCWHFPMSQLIAPRISMNIESFLGLIYTIMNESVSAQINHCSISPRKESIPRLSNPRKAMVDILDLCFCSQGGHSVLNRHFGSVFRC
jgi:hypothetical protein